MQTPGKGIASAFIAGDWHTGALNKATYNILKQHALSLPPNMRNLIINGDFLDASHLMKNQPDFKKWIKRGDGMDEYFLPMCEAEIEWGNEILDDLQKVFKEIIFIYGNHDWRYEWFGSICAPAYKHNFDLNLKLHLDKRGIDYVKYNDWLDWGSNLAITHGMAHGATCHKKHYELSGAKNVVFSHIHRYECKAFAVRGHTRNSVSLPAMCDLNPEYIRNTENNWSNGYGQILMRPDSQFNMYIHQVWDDELVLPDGLVLRG